MNFLGRSSSIAGIVCLLFAAPLLLYADTGSTPTVITPDGGRYFGRLVEGMRQGFGRIEWPNGARYEGGFDKGLYSGHGTWQSASGIRYEGNFSAGMMSGSGRMALTDGTVYVGEFREDEFAGPGEIIYKDGRKYIGGFDRGLYHGKGRYETPEGDVYEGDFLNGEFTGEGQYTLKDGSRYQGKVVNWQPHGKGTYTDARASTYEGQFSSGALTGSGRMTSKDGSYYEGGFLNWRFHGQGVYRHTNGDEYKGGFAHGLYDGEGTLTYAVPQSDGRSKDVGTWRYGVLADTQQERQTRSNVETALYNQRALLDQALSGLAQHDPGSVDMYFLGVGGDGAQEVFRREVQFVRDQFDREFGTMNRSLALINSRTSVASVPMATLTSIRESLKAIAAKMDREQDILFLFLTSHGSKDHELTLAQNGMELHGLHAKELGDMLKQSGIRWKVVIISACYSGGFIDAVKNDHTLVITAARYDRRSFGCADDNDFTYFGRAFFKESLTQHKSFSEAFKNAKTLVEEWEAKDIKDASGDDKRSAHSLPQIHEPAPVRAYLQQWREQLSRKNATPARAALTAR